MGLELVKRHALNIMLVHARLFQLFNCVSQLNYEMAMNIERERVEL
jgi:hypothetical protein